MEQNTDNMTLFDWDKYSDQSLLIETAKESFAWAEWHLNQTISPEMITESSMN